MRAPEDIADTQITSSILKCTDPLQYFIEMEGMKYTIVKQFNKWQLRSTQRWDPEEKGEESCFLDILVVTGLTEDFIHACHWVHKKRKGHFIDRDGSLDNE